MSIVKYNKGVHDESEIEKDIPSGAAKFSQGCEESISW